MKHLKKTGVAAAGIALTIAVTAGSCSDEPKQSAQKSGQALTETAFAQQQTAVPYPASQMRSSLERSNLKARLLTLNSASKIGYVYLINFGKIIGYYSIKGKVSNTDSQLTTSTTVERHGDAQGGNMAYDAPGDDGTYGPNESGNFFFTTEGVLVESDLQYLYADAPLPIDVPRINAAGPSK